MFENCPKGGKCIVKPEAYAGIYGEVAAQINGETAEMIYRLFRGQTVVFPQRLYDQEYVRSFVLENEGKYTVRELSVLFGYSDRRIRQFKKSDKIQAK